MTLREEILQQTQHICKKIDVIQSEISGIKQEMVRYAVTTDTITKDMDLIKEFRTDQEKINNRAWGVFAAVSSVAAILWGLLITFAKSIFHFGKL